MDCDGVRGRMTTGTIFDVQRFSLHDGPGIRTTVFCKGCPLRCLWCQNPEGLERDIRVWNFANLCVGCGNCMTACRHGALSAGADGKPVIDHDRCKRCGACIEECNRNALALDGREWGAEELARTLLADTVFFAASGGGVTFSGGEPLAQAEFVRDAAERMREAGVPTALETCLDVPWESVELVAPHIDFFQIDLKLADPGRHRDATGRDNGRILENFRRLAKLVPDGKHWRVRIPLVPGYTADKDNIRAIGAIVAEANPDIEVELLNFNPLAEAKYRRMRERKFAPSGATPFTDAEMREFQMIARVFTE